LDTAEAEKEKAAEAKAKPAKEKADAALQREDNTTYCPKGFPYPYDENFSWCCTVNREKVFASLGKSCDGTELHAADETGTQYLSKCCDGQKVRCPKPPCKFYQASAFRGGIGWSIVLLGLVVSLQQ
jgi:hypothetical protein